MANHGGEFEEYGAQFVGLAGTLGAGKDTGADHLAESHNFLHVSTGDLLRDVARRQGLDTDRNTLVELGIQLRQEYGSQGALIIKAIEQWREERDRHMGGLVVTGMRAIGEAQEILNNGGALLFVDAPVETRYHRILARQRDGETSKSLNQFIEHDIIEFDGDRYDATRPNLGAIKRMSQLVLKNSSNDVRSFIYELDHELRLTH